MIQFSAIPILSTASFLLLKKTVFSFMYLPVFFTELTDYDPSCSPSTNMENIGSHVIPEKLQNHPEDACCGKEAKVAHIHLKMDALAVSRWRVSIRKLQDLNSHQGKNTGLCFVDSHVRPALS